MIPPPVIPPTLRYPLKFNIAATFATYVLSLVTGNVSQVDRVWTFLPTIYTAYWALLPLWPRADRTKAWVYFVPHVPEEADEFVNTYSPRALLMLGLVFTWMCRLSYNTYRRGLFNLQDEDYRWAVLRTKIPTWLFQFFNLTFIAITQNILLMLLGLPTLRAAAHPTPLGPTDYVLGSTALTLLALEFTADNQQFAFQTFKHAARGAYDARAQWPGARLRWTEADRQRGFIARGLWAWSRHPNFFCEQAFWGVITLFPLLTSPTPPLPPAAEATLADAVRALLELAPALALCVLFVSSTVFTESVSLSKYPAAYRAYQQRVAMFAPWLTPAWGAWLYATGGQAEARRVERLVWGQKLEVEGKRERSPVVVAVKSVRVETRRSPRVEETRRSPRVEETRRSPRMEEKRRSPRVEEKKLRSPKAEGKKRK